jgi:hypothetical protein
MKRCVSAVLSVLMLAGVGRAAERDLLDAIRADQPMADGHSCRPSAPTRTRRDRRCSLCSLRAFRCNQRGTSFLLRTQLEDGTWFLRSRAFGFQA